MTAKTIAVLGAGGRGRRFAEMIHRLEQWARVVAVAEPREDYRRSFAEAHKIAQSHVFKTWQEFCQQPKLCDAVVISTMDRDHVGPALICLQKGYDLMIEKPMATTLEDCRAIAAAQRDSLRIVGVCHSLRYQKGFRNVKEVIDSGTIGQIVTLSQIEQVDWWHQAHSFVRGNWGNEAGSTFMLLAKSCHDIDYICYLVGQPCLSVQSYGALTYFRRENAPSGSTDRCSDPCPHAMTCPYSAYRWYVDTKRDQWPAEVCSHDHSYEAHLQAIRTGPYGRCVWKCDNDVVDHQVVSFQFANDITATFTMTAFTQGGGRRLRVHGTLGELFFDEHEITVKTFADGNVQKIKLGSEEGGHGGGDFRVVREWVRALHSRDDSRIVANAHESLKTHSVVFAAEKSRRERRIVEIAELQEAAAHQLQARSSRAGRSAQMAATP